MRSREGRKGGRGARKIKIEGRDELVRRMEVKKIKGWCKKEREKRRDEWTERQNRGSGMKEGRRKKEKEKGRRKRKEMRE